MRIRHGCLHAVLVALVVLSSACQRGPGNEVVNDFSEAKRLLEEEVYADHRETFYCGCRFSANKRVRCVLGSGERARRVEWEHLVAASRFGKTFAEWQPESSWECEVPSWLRTVTGLRCRKMSGRQNAAQLSPEFRRMEADLYNLVPAVGIVNEARGARLHGEIPGEERRFGKCDVEISGDVMEPAPAVRGDIARTYFYMAAAYPGRVILDPVETQRFTRWAADDPVDQWECLRAQRIENLQGNENAQVSIPCAERGWW